MVLHMLKVTLECKNARSEVIAEILSEFTDQYKIWHHYGQYYAMFTLKSLFRLIELSMKLEKRGIEFTFNKIQKVKSKWRR